MPTQPPLISIITPAYNSAATLGAAIDAARAQSFADWEMVIVDDCSGDGTVSLAERYALEDDRIRIIRRAENGGPAAARNKSLEAALGRYVAFLDADDLWLPKKLAHQLNFMQENNVAISCTAYRRFRDGNQPGRVLKCPPRVTFDTLLRNTCVGTLTVMIDRDKTGPIAFDTHLAGHEDLALWLHLTKAGHDIMFLDEDLARYRIMPNSQSSKTIRSAWWTWRIYRDIAGLPPKKAFAAFMGYAFHAVWKRIF